MKDWLYVILGITVALAVMFVAWGIKPYMEMNTFNKFSTDKKATFLDALFAELRIEGCR